MWNVGAQQEPQQDAPREFRLAVVDPNRVKVGQAVPPQTVTQAELEEVNLTPIIGAFKDLNTAMQISAHNAYDPRAQQAILRARRTLEVVRRSPPPNQAWVGAVVEPFAQALNLMVPAVREGLRIRVEMAERMLSQPTIAIPLNFDLAPGQESTSIENKNPYLGSGPANYDNALWAITAIETPPSFVLGGGCCSPGPNVLITELTFAGHDYVRAGLQGVTNWPGNTGRLAGNQGYPIWMFSADKTYRRATAFRPWNLSGAEGIVGAVMRETGSINIRVRNANAQPCAECPFLDSIIIHCAASLCGMPWKKENLAKMYYPLAMQAQVALSLGSFQARALGKQFDASLIPQLTQMLQAQSALQSGDASLLDMGQGYDSFL
jgi:hypothetical protein